MDESAKIEPGKLFVGGLAWETTKESMQAHFEKFGEVSDCVVMVDQITGKPRGFGFVTFASSCSVAKALEVPRKDHILDGKQIDPKLATQKGAGKCKCKLFIGGVSPDTSDHTLAEFVTRFFGDNGLDCCVVHVDLKVDDKKKNKGFAFMEVSSKEGVDCLIEHGPYYEIDGKKVEFKRANPQDKKGAGQVHGDHNHQVVFNQQGTGYYMDRGQHGSYLYSGYPTGYSNYPPQPAAPQYNYPQYSGRGYTGQQQMGNYSNDAAYNQASSTFANADSNYTSTGLYQGYGGQQAGYNYGGEQASGGSPSSYSRVGMNSQSRGGVNHSYQGYGSR